ncbi:DUF6221 family protein [Streptomyces acidiscabies]|uniref:Uncharacterized protein n=1 Tax=Streptomyces acidiscabies TaxID=42234 RepID=A0A0L0KGV8_9ACTN|nr:DUF6221 family protein [Streptomyces acidiscabies]KND36850.1 hypothetical protein IQ63_11345 [Streptomyces acidiscabies]
MDELVRFLRARYEKDNHAYAYVAQRFGGDALLDSQLPMLDMVDALARKYEGMSTGDVRRPGVEFALRMLAQAYYEHPGYRKEWQPDR